MLRSFLWNGTENEQSFLPVSWTKVCVPKSEGSRSQGLYPMVIRWAFRTLAALSKV